MPSFQTCYYPLLDLLEHLTASCFHPGHFASPVPIPVQDREQKKFLHPTEQGKEQSSHCRTKISKLSVLKPQQHAAFNLYCRQQPAAGGRASPDLPDTPTPSTQSMSNVSLSCPVAGIAPSSHYIWSLPLAQQSGDLLTLLRSLWPSQRICYGDQ